VSNDPPQTAADATQTADPQAATLALDYASARVTKPKVLKSRWFSLGILGLVEGVAAHNIAYFSGCGPIPLALLGFLLAAIMAFLTRRPKWTVRKRWWVRAGGLLLLGLLLLGIAYTTKFPNRPRAFAELFGTTPPTQVQGLQVRRAWFDGSITTYQFKVDQPTLDWLLKTPATQPTDSRGSWWKGAAWVKTPQDPGTLPQRIWNNSTMVAWIANPAWRTMPSLTNPVLYERHFGKGQPQSGTAYLIWDPVTQTVYVALYWDMG
jgi:hypothetical protein